ncbi:hypothetical protein [Bradyrhizobium cenepequi]
MTVSLDGRETKLAIVTSGPARLTRKEESDEVRRLLPKIAQAKAVTVFVGDRIYPVEPGALAQASNTLGACERDASAM